MLTRLAGGIFLATLALTSAWADGPDRKVTVVFDHALPNVPGKSMKGVLVEYGPGASSPAHTHPASAFIYATVLEGAVRIQVNGGPVTVYRAGENFIEMPGDHHDISANAATPNRPSCWPSSSSIPAPRSSSRRTRSRAGVPRDTLSHRNFVTLRTGASSGLR